MAWWEGVDETRVLVAQGPSTSGKNAGTVLSLRHPRTGNKACYLYTDGGLQELHWFKQSYGSWFLGDYVCEDGRLYTVTPVDPVFILLPVFEEAGMKKQMEETINFLMKRFNALGIPTSQDPCDGDD